MKKTGFWLLLIGLILLLSTAAALLLYGGSAKQTAEITLDGALYQTVDLRRDQTFTVESEWGRNTIIVKNGSIRVEEASCPDHVCVQMGACSGGAPIVCLPNRLVISFTGESGVDGAAG